MNVSDVSGSSSGGQDQHDSLFSVFVSSFSYFLYKCRRPNGGAGLDAFGRVGSDVTCSADLWVSPLGIMAFPVFFGFSSTCL